LPSFSDIFKADFCLYFLFSPCVQFIQIFLIYSLSEYYVNNGANITFIMETGCGSPCFVGPVVFFSCYSLTGPIRSLELVSKLLFFLHSESPVSHLNTLTGNIIVTEYRGWVVSTPYSEGPGFRSWTWDRLYWGFCVFSVPPIMLE
jgi:hypothetical protein